MPHFIRFLPSFFAANGKKTKKGGRAFRKSGKSHFFEFLQGAMCTPLAHTCPLRSAKSHAQVAAFCELIKSRTKAFLHHDGFSTDEGGRAFRKSGKNSKTPLKRQKPLQGGCKCLRGHPAFYFCARRQSTAADWARVALPWGASISPSMPPTMPWPTAHSMASSAQEAT